jgi:GNAT superfamily N-acetyltransferase
VSDFFVRPARSSDWEAFHAFLIDRDRPLDSLEAARGRFEHKLASSLHCVLVAELEGRVVGISMAHEWDEYIMSGRKQIRFSTLEVLPEYRTRGIGKALFEATRDWAQGIGATWFEWYASLSAVPFYEHLGYRGIGNSHPDHPYFEIEFKPD